MLSRPVGTTIEFYDLGPVAAAFILVFVGVGSIEATRGSVLTDLFPVEIRYSGVALSYNVAYVLAGSAPLLAASIVGSTGSITWMVVILAVVALIAVPVAFFRPRVAEVVAGSAFTPAPVILTSGSPQSRRCEPGGISGLR